MKNRLARFVCTLTLVSALASCYTLEHKVGSGSQTGVEAEKRQWYFLFGLVPLNEVDSHQMAGGAASYEVKSEINFVDVTINLFTGWVTIYSQTVTVTK